MSDHLYLFWMLLWEELIDIIIRSLQLLKLNMLIRLLLKQNVLDEFKFKQLAFYQQIDRYFSVFKFLN